MITAYCDGAQRGNAGGWGLVATGNLGTMERRGSVISASSTEVELMAGIYALIHLKPYANEQIRVISDSNYLVNGMKKQLKQWKSTGWGGGSLKNVAMWKKLDALASKFKHLSFEWVKSHNGNRGNGLSHDLATFALSDLEWLNSIKLRDIGVFESLKLMVPRTALKNSDLQEYMPFSGLNLLHFLRNVVCADERLLARTIDIVQADQWVSVRTVDRLMKCGDDEAKRIALCECVYEGLYLSEDFNRDMREFLKAEAAADRHFMDNMIDRLISW